MVTLEKKALRKEVIKCVLTDLKYCSYEAVPGLIVLGLIGAAAGGINTSQDNNTLNQLFGILKGAALTSGTYTIISSGFIGLRGILDYNVMMKRGYADSIEEIESNSSVSC